MVCPCLGCFASSGNGGSRIYKGDGAKEQAPQAPSGVGCGEGVSPPHWGRDLGKGRSPHLLHTETRGVGRGCPLPIGERSGEGQSPPPPEKSFDFGSQNGDFRCILGTIFTVQLYLV